MNRKITTLFLLCICLFASACSTSIVVNSTQDFPDYNISDGECRTVRNNCTLRAAIMEANLSDDESLITFKDIKLIVLDSPLPILTASNTHIDGGGVVVVDGKDFSDRDGAGIEIYNSSHNIIQGIRTNNFNRGIYIHSDNGSAENNIIGYQKRDIGDSSKINVFYGNGVGIEISGQGSTNNIISGNIIGVKRDGETPKPNDDSGILISNGANNNLIGSTTGAGILNGGNLISANSGHGIEISGANNITIAGNYIGTDLSGTSALGNAQDGIAITNKSFDIFIGGSEDVANLIANNGGYGLFIGDETENIQIQSNTIHSNGKD